MNQPKKNNKDLGNSGENIARLFLESKGYKIIEKNYRANRKEIDIIAQKDEYIIFAEVKTRSSAAFGIPSESVNIKKQQNIICRCFAVPTLTQAAPNFDELRVFTSINIIYSSFRAIMSISFRNAL